MVHVGKEMMYTVAMTAIVEGRTWAGSKKASRKDSAQADTWRGQVSTVD